MALRCRKMALGSPHKSQKKHATVVIFGVFGPRITLVWLKMVLRWPKRDPRHGPDRPKSAQDGPNTGPREANLVQDSSR